MRVPGVRDACTRRVASTKSKKFMKLTFLFCKIFVLESCLKVIQYWKYIQFMFFMKSDNKCHICEIWNFAKFATWHLCWKKLKWELCKSMKTSFKLFLTVLANNIFQKLWKWSANEKLEGKSPSIQRKTSKQRLREIEKNQQQIKITLI